MLRLLSLLPALVAVAATVGLPVPAQATAPDRAGHLLTRAATRSADAPPLSITIDSLTPSYIPRRGPVRITGSITNHDDSPWTAINVEAFVGTTTITTPAELDEAARTDPATYVGDRVTTPGTYATIPRIGAGRTVQYSLSLPRSEIRVSEPGVYFFGVHALGSGPDGRLDGADGRARTFLPLVPRTRRAVDTALVVPLRHGIEQAPDGSLQDVAGWTRTLSPGGQLRSLVDFGASAGSRPLTWLVDPALTDAVRRLTAGNPPRSLAPTDTAGGGEPSGSPSTGVTAEPEPSGTGSAAPDSDTGTGTEAQESADAAAAAEAGRSFLDRLKVALDSSQVLALPYGDPDVAAAAEHDPPLFELARRRSGPALDPLGVSTSAGISSPSGFLDAAGIRLTDKDATLLVTDRMFGGDAPAVARAAGRRLIVTSSGAAAGGPGPDDPLAPVALRQRIVSEAALRLLSPGRRPLVVLIPHDWSPAATNGFFEGLDVPWIHLTNVGGATMRAGTPVALSDLAYPPRQARRELGARIFAAADALVAAGHTLQTVLTRNDDVGTAVADQALTATSYASRAHPGRSLASLVRAREQIDQQLASVRIEAPRAVTLSSASGKFAATITNGLDQPVTVSVKALTDRPMQISGQDTVDIGPGGRTTVLLDAQTHTPGVHNVTLVVTDSEGTPLGSSDQLPIRSAQVSNVIWLILGTGVALLLGAIAVRLVRRVRSAARVGAPTERQA